MVDGTSPNDRRMRVVRKLMRLLGRIADLPTHYPRGLFLATSDDFDMVTDMRVVNSAWP